MSDETHVLIPQSIRHATFVRAMPEKTYDAIATREGLDGWFTVGAEVEARPGGHIRFNWVDWGPDKVTASDEGPVLDAERGKKFVFQWHPDNNEYATTVTIEFKEVKGGTNVYLQEDGFKDTFDGLKAMMECATGWGEALTLMKYYVEHGLRY